MVNDKQFVIAKKPYEKKGFLKIYLQNKYILSYQEKLKVYLSKGPKQGILIGIAWQCDDQRKTPYEELDQLTNTDKDIKLDDVYEMEKTWCGRYILIVQDTVFLDTSGLLGVFFHENALSSSYSILCDIVGITNKYTNRAFGVGMGYHPGMLTMHHSIQRMLPSQTYNFEKHIINYRELYPEKEVLKFSEEQLIDKFLRYFSTSLLNMRKEVPGDFWLSLTGGHDSRTLMALMEYAGIPYNCFTLDVENLTEADRKIPFKLAALRHRKALFIKRIYHNFSFKRMKEYIAHSNGFAKDEDALSYSFGQYQVLTQHSKPAVILRSSIWEIAIQYYRKFDDKKGKINLDQIHKIFPILKSDEAAVNSILQYLQYIRINTEKCLSESERFFWEMREGCWLPSIEQSCDIMDDIIFLQPCNSKVFLKFLFPLARDEKEPWKKGHQEKIIEKCCPELLSIDFASKVEHKLVKRSPLEKLFAKIFSVIAHLYLYGFKGFLVFSGFYVKNNIHLT